MPPRAASRRACAASLQKNGATCWRGESPIVEAEVHRQTAPKKMATPMRKRAPKLMEQCFA